MVNGQLLITYPWYFLALCILLGSGMAAWMYFREKLLNDHAFLRPALFLIRAFLLSALAFLLLGPVWKGILSRTEKPIILYLEDGSNSIGAFTDESDLEMYRVMRASALHTVSTGPGTL